MKLYYNNKIEVRKSNIHGWGVFAKENIKNNEMLEQCHWVKLNPTKQEVLNDYMYCWPKHKRDDLKRKGVKFMTIPFGNACVYNSSKELGDNNADWITNLENNLYEFFAIKDIKKNQEILTYYGDAYWNYYNKKK